MALPNGAFCEGIGSIDMPLPNGVFSKGSSRLHGDPALQRRFWHLKPCTMMQDSRVVWWLIGLIALAFGCVVAFRLSAGARLRRRRRKSHGRIVSRGKRPVVKFSVRTRPKVK